MDEILRPGFHQAGLERINEQMEHINIAKTKHTSASMQLESPDQDFSSGKDTKIPLSDNRNIIQLLNSNSKDEGRFITASGMTQGEIHSSTYCNTEKKESIIVRNTSTGHQEENHVNISSCVQDITSSPMEAESISVEYFRQDAKLSSEDDLDMSCRSDTKEQGQIYSDKINDQEKSSLIKVRIDIMLNN